MKIKKILVIIFILFLIFFVSLLFIYKYLFSPARLNKIVTEYFSENYGLSFKTNNIKSKHFTETVFENVTIYDSGKKYFHCEKINLKYTFSFSLIFLKLNIIISSPENDYNFFSRISKPKKTSDKIKYFPLYINSFIIEKGYLTFTDFENEKFYKPVFENVTMNVSRADISGEINCSLTMSLKKGKIYRYNQEDHLKIDTVFILNILKDEIEFKKVFLISEKGSLETNGKLYGLLIKKQPFLNAEILFKNYKLDNLIDFNEKIILDGEIKLRYTSKNTKKLNYFDITGKELFVNINNVKCPLSVRGFIYSDREFNIKIKSNKDCNLNTLFPLFFNKSNIKLFGDLNFITEISVQDNKIDTSSDIKIKNGKISGFNMFKTLSKLSGKKEFIDFVFTSSGIITTSKLKTSLKNIKIDTKDFAFIFNGYISKEEDINMNIEFLSGKDFWGKNMYPGKVRNKLEEKNDIIKEEFKVKGKITDPKFEFKLSDYMQKLLIENALKKTEDILRGLKK